MSESPAVMFGSWFAQVVTVGVLWHYATFELAMFGATVLILASQAAVYSTVAE